MKKIHTVKTIFHRTCIIFNVEEAKTDEKFPYSFLFFGKILTGGSNMLVFIKNSS